METFAVDKSFYDIGANDLKELWDSDLDPAITEVFRGDADDWAAFLDVKPQVVLHDRLMTDAALGTMPIKSEHSYSLTSDGDSMPDSPVSLENKVDDMEDECYPCIPLNSATGQTRLGAESPEIFIKDEPMSDLDSDDSDCSMSPDSPPPLYHADVKHSVSQQSLLKQSTILLTSSRGNLFGPHNRVVIPKLNIKLEANVGSGGSFSLPPTPPSSSSSDSEGNVSPDRQSRQSSGAARIFLSASNASTANRQPIQTPLISNQPKGSTGMLFLTEEEKRTLLAEGYPIPTRLPLTKAEEKSLKKIRRKIKNKISAQESRRKKKEYMDALERKVEVLTSENTDYKKKIETLEESNTTLLSQLQKLQALVARGNQSSSRVNPSTATANGSQHITRSSANK